MGHEETAMRFRLVTEPTAPPTTGGPRWQAMTTPDQALRSPLGTTLDTGAVTSARARQAITRTERPALLTRLAAQVVKAQAVHALHAQGASVREIADQLEVSKSDVGRELKYGPRRLVGIAPADAAAIADAVEAAWS